VLRLSGEEKYGSAFFLTDPFHHPTSRRTFVEENVDLKLEVTRVGQLLE
jgi:hypothetical protein